MNKLFALLPLLGCVDKDASVDSGDDALVLSSGFGEDSITVTSAGGEETNSCDGWYPATPQSVMTLETNLLQMWVEADTTDVVLMIVFGASTFCSDNDDGLPRVDRGSWSAGDYELFVGHPEEGGAATEVVLTAVEG